MDNNSLMTNEMIEQIKQVMGQARANVAKVVNNELITAYWSISNWDILINTRSIGIIGFYRRD